LLEYYTIKIGGIEFDFIAKSYGEIDAVTGSKLLIGRIYIDKIDYMSIGEEA